MITVIGSLNMDLVVMVNRYPKIGETLIGDEFHTSYGGKGANQAVAAARLNAKVNMIGAVGNDDFGEEYIRHLKKSGINTAHIIKVTDKPTGTASITIANNDNAIIVVPGANDSLTPKHITEKKDVILKSKVIVMQLEVPLETIAAVLKITDGTDIITILNPAPYKAIPGEWLDKITYLTPNEHEAELLLTEIDRNQLKSKLIITRGNKGVSLQEDNRELNLAAPPVKVVDTTGAGDTFNGVLATYLLKGRSVKEACVYAMSAASYSVTKLGAQTGMPDYLSLERFINNQGDIS